MEPSVMSYFSVFREVGTYNTIYLEEYCYIPCSDKYMMCLENGYLTCRCCRYRMDGCILHRQRTLVFLEVKTKNILYVSVISYVRHQTSFFLFFDLKAKAIGLILARLSEYIICIWIFFFFSADVGYARLLTPMDTQLLRYGPVVMMRNSWKYRKILMEFVNLEMYGRKGCVCALYEFQIHSVKFFWTF